MSTVTKALETITEAVSSAHGPEDFTKAIGAFTGSIEKVLPKMKELKEAHPEWETDPPEELKGTFDKFNAAADKFKDEAVPKIMKAVTDHPDDTALKDAVQKFHGLMSQL